MELLPSPEGKVCAGGISWKDYVDTIDAMAYHIHSEIRWDYPESPGLCDGAEREERNISIWIKWRLKTNVRHLWIIKMDLILCLRSNEKLQ